MIVEWKELGGFLKARGEPAYRLGQIQQAYFQNLVSDWSEIANLPAALRSELAERLPFLPLKIVNVVTSKRGDALKALFATKDDKRVESVLMLYPERATVCASVQIGCPLACIFCATGQSGFARNLGIDEIVEQVVFWQRYMKQNRIGRGKVTNVVFMGMGEPFLNTDNVFNAIERLNDPKGFGLGSRHFSISTIGIPEGIRELASFNDQVSLAVSLHAPEQKLREKLMPATKKYALSKTMAAVKEYIATTNRKVFFEYTMIEGVNDDQRSAAGVVNLLGRENLFCVNLVSYNQTHATYSPSPRHTVVAFRNYLAKRGINVTMRRSLGAEIWAACGQLQATEGNK